MHCPLWRWRSQEMCSDIQFSISIHLPLILAYNFIVDVAITTLKLLIKSLIPSRSKTEHLDYSCGWSSMGEDSGTWYVAHERRMALRHGLAFLCWTDELFLIIATLVSMKWEVRTTAVTQIYGICTSSRNTFEILHRNWFSSIFEHISRKNAYISKSNALATLGSWFAPHNVIFAVILHPLLSVWKSS
jgi:hypothetical protein